jgi:hypothetical protein
LYIAGIDHDVDKVPRLLIRAGGRVSCAFGQTDEEGGVDGEQIDLRRVDEREQTSRVRMIEEYELANDVRRRRRGCEPSQRRLRQRCGWKRSA